MRVVGVIGLFVFWTIIGWMGLQMYRADNSPSTGILLVSLCALCCSVYVGLRYYRLNVSDGMYAAKKTGLKLGILLVALIVAFVIQRIFSSVG